MQWDIGVLYLQVKIRVTDAPEVHMGHLQSWMPHNALDSVRLVVFALKALRKGAPVPVQLDIIV
ncbi:hypothetical protein EBV26_12755 [bacterium]|nr:hypothetical protein [bacterium]